MTAKAKRSRTCDPRSQSDNPHDLLEHTTASRSAGDSWGGPLPGDGEHTLHVLGAISGGRDATLAMLRGNRWLGVELVLGDRR